jgi:Uma2 family endonuclease
MTPTTASVTPSVPAAPPPAVVRDDDPLFEIIDGKQVELPPMSVRSALVAFELARKLGNFAEERALGRAVVEALFHLPLSGKDRSRRPDAAFVSYQRWAKDRGIPPDEDTAWEVAPDLAVEVVSPSDRVEELMTKVVEYFECGVRLVWVLYPRQRFVHVYEFLTRIRGLTVEDELDGGDVLPGFRLSLDLLMPVQGG